MTWEDAGSTAARVATDVGRLLLGLRTRGGGAAADGAAHDAVVEALSEAYPRDPVLSEEGERGHDLRSGRVWVVDPLDGTREYLEGRDDWAVHVALAVDGTLVAGAVALPARDTTLSTVAPPPLAPAPAGAVRVAVSRTRRPPAALALAERIGADVVELGSAGAKAMAVVLGEVDAYAHAGGINVWDVAAPAVVAAAAGCHVSRLDGTPLRIGGHGTHVEDVLVCHPAIAGRILGTT